MLNSRYPANRNGTWFMMISVSALSLAIAGEGSGLRRFRDRFSLDRLFCLASFGVRGVNGPSPQTGAGVAPYDGAIARAMASVERRRENGVELKM